MANRTVGPAVGLLLGAALLAACDAGAGAARETSALRARVDAQSTEIDALKKAVKEQDARARALEEQLAAVRAQGEAAKTAARGAAKPGASGEEAAAGGAPAADGAAATPAAEALSAYLSTDEGQKKVLEAVRADEKRRQEEQDKRRADQMRGFLKDRVTGYLTEQLNLDSNQQESVLKIANEAMDRMTEIWRAARDAQGDPNAFATVREKSQEVRQQAMDRLQQALTVDQYNKFQEISGDGGGFLFGGRGPGGFGGGGGAPPGGGAGGGRGR